MVFAGVDYIERTEFIAGVDVAWRKSRDAEFEPRNNVDGEVHKE
jgi:hypothetical protein